jgi:hypothetical protein
MVKDDTMAGRLTMVIDDTMGSGYQEFPPCLPQQDFGQINA